MGTARMNDLDVGGWLFHIYLLVIDESCTHS